MQWLVDTVPAKMMTAMLVEAVVRRVAECRGYARFAPRGHRARQPWRSIASGGSERVSVGGELGFHVPIGCTSAKFVRTKPGGMIVTSPLSPPSSLRAAPTWRNIPTGSVLSYVLPRSAFYAVRLFDANAGIYAAATASISIRYPSPKSMETSTKVMAGAAGGVVVQKKRSRALL